MTNYDPLIFATYERFLLCQYSIDTKGLYYSTEGYLIYCPGTTPETKSHEGESIHQWLENYRMIGQSIRIVNELPANAVRIDEQIKSAKPSGTGYLITQSDFDYEINLLIPNIFPDYEVRAYYPHVVINFYEEITPEGAQELQTIFEKNGFPYKVRFTHDPIIKSNGEIEDNGFWKPITPFRKAKKELSSNLYTAWEKDEDNWVTNRRDILNNPTLLDLKPDSLKPKIFRGLVDGSMKVPGNIRNYLSLFEQVNLVMPPKDAIDNFLNGLGISKKELIGLIQLNKVQLLLPESIEKYDLPLIEEALEANSTNIHFTRSINAFTLQEMRLRNPLLFPAISTIEKQDLLRAVDESLSFLDSANRAIAKKIIADTGHGWMSIPNAINEHNSSFLSQYGIVNILAPVIQHFTGRDVAFELLISAPAVEWAAATGSVLMPITGQGMDATSYYQLIADFYSGVPDTPMVIPKPDYANFAVEEVLAIAKHVPILEFANTFNGDEIKRFRKVIMDVSNTSTSPEDLEATIEAFNYFVRQYERDKNKLAAWDLRGFILNQAGKVTGVPYASWALKFLTKTMQKNGSKFEHVGSIIDSLEGQLQGAYPSAILVSRMKDKIKKKI